VWKPLLAQRFFYARATHKMNKNHMEVTMKTIRQIAEEIGVTKQAVYKRYKGKLYKAVYPYARKVCDTIYILEQGETIIKRDFLQDSAYYGAHTEYTPDTLILMLQKELEIKNKQIEELTATIKIQAGNAKHAPMKKVYTSKKRIVSEPKSTPIKRLITHRK
jgi:vacuolar-type H+-ATPase catalytic subunit A/Vma1